MEGSINCSVDPLSCIPLTNIRCISPSGVERLKRSLSNGNGGLNYIAGSDTPIVVSLSGSFHHYISNYFQSECGLPESESNTKIKSRKDWYGVVDGMHRLKAITDLAAEYPDSWEGFLWPVTIIKGDCNIQVLKQLARQQNIKHSDAFYVESTFYDMLQGLRDEADRLTTLRNGKRPVAKEVAAAYDGFGHQKESTVKQTASTAMRLPMRVIKTIGEITNGEHPDLAGDGDSSDEKKVMETVDCRVFRKFVHITSLKSSTVFMTAPESMPGEEGIECQINTLHRIAELGLMHRKKSFCSYIKPAQPATVVEQFKKAVLAHKEVQKFKAFLEREKWPNEMTTVLHNLLRTTKLDEDVQQNVGNREILPILIEKYRKHYPAIAVQKELKFLASLKISERETREMQCAVQQSNINTKDKPVGQSQYSKRKPDENGDTRTAQAPIKTDTDSTIGNQNSSFRIESAENPSSIVLNDSILPEQGVCSTNASERLETRKRVIQEVSCPSSKATFENNVDILTGIGIHCHQMRWQDFDKTIRKTTDSRFDMMLIDPPYGTPECRSRAGSLYDNFVDDKEMRAVSQFARRVLVPGGSVFLFSSIQYATGWMKSLETENFKVMKHLFVVVKKTERLQFTRAELFPQNACEYGILAYAPGRHPENFKPDFISPYSMVQCSEKRKFSTISGVLVPQHKLLKPGTKSPVLTEEKNPDLLAELMTTFCPQKGSVIDIYAGTLTTAIAAMRTNRKCTSVEADSALFRLAHQRLKLIAPSLQVGLRKNNKRLRPTTVSNTVTRSKSRSAVSQAEESATIAKTSVLLGSQLKTQSNTEHCIHEKNVQHTFMAGEEVLLLHEGKEVGLAQLFPPKQNGQTFCTTIHGTRLNEELAGSSGKHGGKPPFLAAITKCFIYDEHKSTKNPYSCPGPEEPPTTLGGLHAAGIYVWDVGCMKPKRYSKT